MSGTDHTSDSDSTVVSVSRHGQATIPKRFRERLGIEAPGKVAFRAMDDGTVVVESVPSPDEMRGFAADREATTDSPATEILAAQRARERDQRADEE
jgi:AbrB family looped-hinge helix DNA binding protein